tara:strand:- start:185 stop:715 length:531 start_codon:yes stop_codon:yes gene_type:complete
MEFGDKIYFYGSKGQYGFLSNFYKCNFECFINNNIIQFNCSEQYFMYFKCITFDPNNSELLNMILKETNPVKIKTLGRKVHNFDKKIWNEKKYSIMLNALYYKFSQNIILQQKLLNTDNKILYEAAPKDKIWGIGFSAEEAIKIEITEYGSNLLGNVLMEIRYKFKEHYSKLNNII